MSAVAISTFLLLFCNAHAQIFGPSLFPLPFNSDALNIAEILGSAGSLNGFPNLNTPSSPVINSLPLSQNYLLPPSQLISNNVAPYNIEYQTPTVINASPSQGPVTLINPQNYNPQPPPTIINSAPSNQEQISVIDVQNPNSQSSTTISQTSYNSPAPIAVTSSQNYNSQPYPTVISSSPSNFQPPVTVISPQTNFQLPPSNISPFSISQPPITVISSQNSPQGNPPPNVISLPPINSQPPRIVISQPSISPLSPPQIINNPPQLVSNSQLMPSVVINSVADNTPQPIVASLIDNTLANSLANAIQLLILSNMLENASGSANSPIGSCINNYEILTPDFSPIPAISVNYPNNIISSDSVYSALEPVTSFQEPVISFQEPVISFQEPVVSFQEPVISIPELSCGDYIPFSQDSGQNQIYINPNQFATQISPTSGFDVPVALSVPPLAIEVPFPSSIPAQLTCNFGYMDSNVPCVTFNVEPLPSSSYQPVFANFV